MKFKFMKEHKAEFNIERMSNVFNVSRSGYYQFICATPSARSRENERLLERIKQAHKESRETYGSPGIHAELRAQGETCSRKRVAGLMRNSRKKTMNICAPNACGNSRAQRPFAPDAWVSMAR